jgi:hypothetical protein
MAADQHPSSAPRSARDRRCAMLGPLDNRPIIMIEPGELFEIANHVTDLLVAANLRIYRRDNGRLIYCWNWEYRGKVYVQTERLMIRRVRLFIAEVAQVKKFNERRMEWEAIEPPGPLAGLVIRQGPFLKYDAAVDAARFGASCPD